MSDSEQSEAEGQRDSGIFGKLPRSRPGIRSPRREAGRAGPADRASEARPA